MLVFSDYKLPNEFPPDIPSSAQVGSTSYCSKPCKSNLNVNNIASRKLALLIILKRTISQSLIEWNSHRVDSSISRWTITPESIDDAKNTE